MRNMVGLIDTNVLLNYITNREDNIGSGSCLFGAAIVTLVML